MLFVFFVYIDTPSVLYVSKYLSFSFDKFTPQKRYQSINYTYDFIGIQKRVKQFSQNTNLDRLYGSIQMVRS